MSSNKEHLQQQQRHSMGKRNTSCKVAICLVILATFQVNCANSQWAIDDDGCRTPDRGVGVCTVITECKPILDFISQSGRPVSQQIASLLRKYQCGFQGSDVKVCCPSTPIVTFIKNPMTVISDKPVDATAHKNYNLLPLSTCGRLLNDDRIYNGNRTALFEFPWMTLLAYQTDRGPDFKCGGTVINNRYILTAAHCLIKSLIWVRVGEHDTDTEPDCEQQLDGPVCAPTPQDLNIEQIIPHPSYNNPPFQHDIGLIRLASPIDFKPESVRPICLPVTKETREYDFVNATVVVTGWGATESGRNSSVLLKVDLPIMPFSECRFKYPMQANITQRHICAGGRNEQDSCPGDSGGPMHTLGLINKKPRMIQNGIVSFGPSFCATEGNPGVYTNIAYYMDWILDNMKP